MAIVLDLQGLEVPAAEAERLSSTISNGARPRPAACRRIAVAMNAAHSRKRSVVLPVPVPPITTWCERSRS